MMAKVYDLLNFNDRQI